MVKEMMEFEKNHHFVIFNQIIHPGNDHQWMKLSNERLGKKRKVEERFMGNFAVEGLDCHHLCLLVFLNQFYCH